jgi:hypothetical protein
MFELLYTDPLCCRGLLKARSVRELVNYALRNNCTRWAVYRPYYQGRRFYNSTDPHFLVIHDDPYWFRQGIPAMQHLK